MSNTNAREGYTMKEWLQVAEWLVERDKGYEPTRLLPWPTRAECVACDGGLGRHRMQVP
jgi:hypothetical protein